MTSTAARSTPTDLWAELTWTPDVLLSQDAAPPATAVTTLTDALDAVGADQVDGLLDLPTLGREHRDQQCDRNTGERRVNTAGVQRHPQREADHRVGGAAADGKVAHECDRNDEEHRDQQRPIRISSE